MNNSLLEVQINILDMILMTFDLRYWIFLMHF